jgi:hypothetical protein
MHLGAATLAGKVQYATSVFGEGLVTLEVVGGSGRIEVVYTYVNQKLHPHLVRHVFTWP